MCNLYSMTTNVEAIHRLFDVDAANDHTGKLPSLPGIFPDYPAPSVMRPWVSSRHRIRRSENNAVERLHR
jgi:putative SOS response-associated peptidase YedK